MSHREPWVPHAGNRLSPASGPSPSAGAGTVLEAFIDASHDVVIVTDLDGRVLRWNRAAEEVCGLTAGEAAGTVLPHFPEELRLRALRDLRDIAANGQVVQRQVHICRSDGGRVAVEMTEIPITDVEGHPSAVLSVGHPVTQPRVSETVGNELATRFAEAVMAPVTAIVGYSQLLGRPQVYEDPVRRKRIIRALHERSFDLDELLGDMEMIADLRSSPLALKLEEVDVAALATDVAGRVKHVDRGHVVVHPGTNASIVRVDRRKLERSLARLLVAVLRYADEGEIRLSVDAKDDWVVISMTAQSTGAEEASVRSRAGAAKRGRDDGVAELQSCPALQFAREVLSAHGGEIEVLAEDESRVVLTARLPCAAAYISGDEEVRA